MSIRLIDRKKDVLVLPSIKKVNRREFLLYSAIVPSLALLPQKNAEAFVPILVGLIARSIIRGVARAVGNSIRKRVVGGTGTYSSLSKRVQARVLEEVSTDLVELGINTVAKSAIDALAKESPQGLWSRHSQENPLTFNIKNHTESYIETSFSLELIDLETNRLEKSEQLFTVEANPKAENQFSYGVFKDLPGIGNKKVIGVTPSGVKGLEISPSGKVLVMNPEKIYV
jgi:hypothetical protein